MMRLVSLFATMAFGLAACGTSTTTTTTSTGSGGVPAIYQARTDIGPNGEALQIPAVRAAYLTERNQRQRVAYTGPEAPNTLVVDPYARVLYHVLENGEAMRFGIAVGSAGKGFSGNAVVSVKKRWPSWTPTANMIRTEPQLYAQFAGGVPGGLTNPLGSRALYLYRNGRDTYYRIHGTMDPSSIGKATSAGCIRLFHQDIMDLYDSLELGARVKVRSQAESLAAEGPMMQTPEGYVVPAGQPPATTVLPASTDNTDAVVTVSSPVESAVPLR
jgi:lipoprotein-anchoring transpeptidase ErfK/SrfK